MTKAKVVKTELGWEPAFWWEGEGWIVEPGSVQPTRAAAEAALRRDLAQCRAIDAADRRYQSGIDYACGCRD